jgi:hypothetical protein
VRGELGDNRPGDERLPRHLRSSRHDTYRTLPVVVAVRRAMARESTALVRSADIARNSAGRRHPVGLIPQGC